MTSRITLAAALCFALAACSGGGGEDPASHTFTYGSPVAVAAYSPEATAADDGSLLLSDGATYQQTGDPVAAETASGSLPTLPDTMADNIFASAGVAFAPADNGMKRVAAALAPTLRGQALGQGFDNPDCVVASAGEVRYDGCRLSVVDMTTTMTMTVNGWFRRSTNVFAWDATVGITMTDVDFNMSGTNHLYGSFTFDASTIKGRARSDVGATARMSGQTASAGTATIADLDLVYETVPTFCVTAGTLEVRRIWTQRPAGMPTTGEYADQGVKFSWQGCGAVLAAHSQ